MASAVFRAIFSAAILGAAAIAVPGAAQFKSDGFKFLEAVKERDGDEVTRFLKEPGSTLVNTRDITSGETALHIVTKRSDALWIRFLTQNGANPNIRDKDGNTPIQIAVIVGPIDSVEALIKAGADINSTNASGETPLMTAVHRRDVALVRLLLEKGANPDQNDNSGRSARVYADLQTGNTLLLNEFKKADESREQTGATQLYGPKF